MKKQAALIAGIMFVAGGASSHGQRASYDATYESPSRYDRADVSVGSTEHIERNSRQAAIPPTDVDTSTAVSHDPAVGSYGSSVSASASSESYSDDGISADSSKRGGSLEARGYDQSANNDEVEGTPDPINPGKQADSSIRGGSAFAREREWNHDSEPGSASIERHHRMKADSSIRGGSLEARGGREARSSYGSDLNLHSESEYNSDAEATRDDFGQGSSATWESDKAQGSVRGSANWNASDDLMRDGLGSESQDTMAYEFNNDASVGGAASSETGANSSEDDSSLRLESDLNSSEQLEENISGEIDLEAQESRLESAGSAPGFQSSTDPNARDSYSSSISSERSTDIHHDESDLNATAEEDEDAAIEAAGAAASSESGSSSSSELETNSSEFESNDPAMNEAGSPLSTSGGEPNFLYQDNRALGVGSAASGEFATSRVNQDADVQSGDEQLAQKVKGILTRESTGTHGLMMHQVARNVQVSANGGEITLTGTVPSEKDKDMVEIRAREVKGVQGVNNQLSVTPEADPAERNLTRGSDLEDVTNELQD